MQPSNATAEGSSRALAKERRRQELAACKALASPAAWAGLSLLSIAVACLPRTPIGTHLQTTRVESLSYPDQLFAALRTLHAAHCALLVSHCTLLWRTQSNGAVTRSHRCHVLQGKHGPCQQTVGRRTIREQAAVRAPRPRCVRALRNDPDALERHGRAIARQQRRLPFLYRRRRQPAPRPQRRVQ